MKSDDCLFVSPPEYQSLQAKRAQLKKQWQQAHHDLGQVISGSSSFVNKTPGFDDTEMHLHRIEEQIHNIDQILDRARLINDAGKLDPNRVTVYSLVEAENTENHQSLSFYLQHIFQTQNNPLIITPASPIGRQLLNKKIGDLVKIALPDKKLNLKINKIKKGFDSRQIIS